MIRNNFASTIKPHESCQTINSPRIADIVDGWRCRVISKVKAHRQDRCQVSYVQMLMIRLTAYKDTTDHTRGASAEDIQYARYVYLYKVCFCPASDHPTKRVVQACTRRRCSRKNCPISSSGRVEASIARKNNVHPRHHKLSVFCAIVHLVVTTIGLLRSPILR